MTPYTVAAVTIPWTAAKVMTCSRAERALIHQGRHGYGHYIVRRYGSPMGVTINLRAGVASGGDAEGDVLGEMIENIQGSMHDDTLTGGKGDNSIWGLGGNDVLNGDRGMDDVRWSRR